MTQCSSGCSTSPTIGQRKHKITIVKTPLKTSQLGASSPTAGAVHGFIEVFKTYAAVDTMLGRSEWAGVSIKGKAVTDKFKIRYHPRYFRAPKQDAKDYRFDSRCMVLYDGRLYQILGMEDVNLEHKELILQCRFEKVV